MSDGSGELWRRAWPIAEEWIGFEPDQRGRSLRELEAEDPELASAVRSLLEPQPVERRSPLEGQRVAGYMIKRLIGRGGMGEVFEAWSLDLERTVALKLMLKASSDERALALFEHEARVQARVAHPNIAQLYEAGKWTDSEGRTVPWIAMQLVPGARTLTELVEAGSRDPAEIARLFTRICDAVGFAHERGILHRDIKPTNILVDEAGEPYVIDFGTARFEDRTQAGAVPVTQDGHIVGTPLYMAPERLERTSGDLPGARSDVFSLGLVLHELLAGAPRFEVPKDSFDLREWGRRLAQPPKTRLHHVDCPKELEWIVAKATSFDAERRYSNATELADDLRRFLADRAPAAVPESATYRLRLFVRRNRAAVATTVVIALVVLVAGGFSVISHFNQVRAEERTALSEEEMSRAYAILETTLRELDPGRGGDDDPRSIVDALTRAMSTHFAMEEPPWRVLALFAEVLRVSGNSEASVEAGEQALAAAQLDSTASTAELDQLERTLAYGLMDVGRLERAAGLFDGLIEPARSAGDSVREGRLLSDIGALQVLRGDFRDAITTLDGALVWADAELEPGSDMRLAVLHNLGTAHAHLGQIQDALISLDPAYRGRVATLGIAHRSTLVSAVQFGKVLVRAGRAPEGRAILAEAQSVVEKRYPPDDETRLQVSSALATALQALEDYPAEIALRKEIVEARTRLHGPDSEKVIASKHNLANAAMQLRDLELAQRVFEEVVDAGRRVYGPRDPRTLEGVGMLGQTLQLAGDYERALELALEAKAGLDGLDRDPLNLIAMYSVVASCLHDLGRHEEAQVAYFEALELAQRHLPPGHQNILALQANRGTLLTDLERYDDAFEAFEDCLDSMAAVGAEHSPTSIVIRGNMGLVFVRQERFEEALPILREAESLITAAIRHWPVFLDLYTNLCRACAHTGDLEGACEAAAFVLENGAPDSKVVRIVRELVERFEIDLDDC